MNCCTERCGFCGRCDDGVQESNPEPEHLFCDNCGRDVYSAVVLAGVGVFCGHSCATLASLMHEAYLHRYQEEHG